MLKSANTEGITGDYVMDSASEVPFNTQVDNNNNVHKHCKKSPVLLRNSTQHYAGNWTPLATK
jgi:hypothetical protein